MDRSLNDLQERAKCVKLNIGDIVVDCVTNDIGILVRRRHHIDIIEDEVYFWDVKWINKTKTHPTLSNLEEESLIMSIAIGTIEWHSVEGESIEL